MIHRPNHSWETSIALAYVLSVATAMPSAWAQTSPSYRLVGGLGSGSGKATGRGGALVGESGIGATAARSSSDSADVIGGFIGRVYFPRMRVTITSEGEEFLSVAFPLHPSSSGVTSVLDELGKPDITKWRLGHWSPQDSTYIEAETGALQTIQRGLGYFLITADSIVVAEDGLTAPIQDFSISLEDGPRGRPAYNQLGNPFHFPISIADLVVSDGRTEAPLVSPENRLTEAVVKVYDADKKSYQPNPPVIDPLTAFWVKKLAPGPVRVIVPYQAAGEDEEGPAAAKPKGALWAVAITARQDRRESEPFVVGAAAVPEGSWNSLCQSNSPEAPGGSLALSLREEGWGRLSGDYVRVFRPAAAATSWEFRARGAELPGEIVLRFRLFEVPAGATVVFGDADGTWSRTVTDAQEITVPARKEQSFRLTVESAGTPRPEIRFADGFRQVYPHPFRQRSGLVFTVARPGPLEARIYDVSGRLIRMLSAAVTDPGERVLLWDGKDHSGRTVAPGVYLARYRVGQLQGVTRMVKIE